MAGIINKEEASQIRNNLRTKIISEPTISRKGKISLLILSGIGVLLFLSAGICIELGFLKLYLIFSNTGAFLVMGSLTVLTVLSEKYQTRNTLIQLILLLLAIAAKRMHLWGSSGFIVITLFSMSVSYLFTGIKILRKEKANKYFRAVGSIASFFIALMSFALILKFQHWAGAGFYISISLLPSLIFTMIVLVTLPGSGYILWGEKIKLMFTRKLLLPWIFFLLFAASALLLPKNISRKIFSKDASEQGTFKMTPYEIEQKEGLEPDQ
ncbi:hypothetical protein ACFLRQ_01570 [Bacteroidota bacterium]